MVSSKLALVLVLTAGGVMSRSSQNFRRLDRLDRRRGPPGGYGAGGTDPLTHPAAPGGGAGGFGNGGTDPLTHPAGAGSGPPVSASSGGQMHWATDASGMTGAELQKHLPSGFFLGSAIDNPDLKDPKVAPLIKYLPYWTPGNSLKMQFVYENENSWQELLKGVTSATKGTPTKVKYHTVIWGAEQSKVMMQQSFSKEAMMKTITDFISTKLCTKLIKEADFWAIDVLNEVFDDSGSGFKKNGYFEVIGEEGYKSVLKLVKRKCPDYKIIVNDYGMESMNAKSNFAFKTIKQWLAEGVPVDAVGLQFHVQLSNRYEDMLASIQRWTKEQIPVVLSEIDVPINLPPSKDDLEKQAQQYGNIVQAALEGGAFGATFWGLTDDHTWFGTQKDASGVGHGKTGAPLLFDEQGKPKPAVAAIVDVFKKWGSKPAGIEGGRATDLGKGKGSDADSSKGDSGDSTGAGAGTGGAEGYGSGSDGSSSGGSGPDAGSDAPDAALGVGNGSGSGSGSGSGAGSSSGSGPGSGEASGGSDDEGPLDRGPPDTGLGGAGSSGSTPISSGGDAGGAGEGYNPGPGSTGSTGGDAGDAGSAPGGGDASPTPGAPPSTQPSQSYGQPGGAPGASSGAPGGAPGGAPAPKPKHHGHEHHEHKHHGHQHHEPTPDDSYGQPGGGAAGSAPSWPPPSVWGAQQGGWGAQQGGWGAQQGGWAGPPGMPGSVPGGLLNKPGGPEGYGAKHRRAMMRRRR
ncbi:Glycoside hydrolase, family 10 [Kalmanozyma brasiliensis GHG001]|uniref:Beta-xylanase n=1 Tax=Kalmanozyma brasiliensis (strain GHG001) TaxID=1365824 RepID=V5EVH9_KALBG|nr:Glycoside hydrolase, family 10 [Kalmanozyma brasiliensis GHG001]EST07258.1 Glycoside hydrolase, family 10 [Kalmanozyma brasiliensis GHG001]